MVCQTLCQRWSPQSDKKIKSIVMIFCYDKTSFSDLLTWIILNGIEIRDDNWTHKMKVLNIPFKSFIKRSKGSKWKQFNCSILHLRGEANKIIHDPENVDGWTTPYLNITNSTNSTNVSSFNPFCWNPAELLIHKKLTDSSKSAWIFWCAYLERQGHD